MSQCLSSLAKACTLPISTSFCALPLCLYHKVSSLTDSRVFLLYKSLLSQFLSAKVCRGVWPSWNNMKHVWNTWMITAQSVNPGCHIYPRLTISATALWGPPSAAKKLWNHVAQGGVVLADVVSEIDLHWIRWYWRHSGFFTSDPRNLHGQIDQNHTSEVRFWMLVRFTRKSLKPLLVIHMFRLTVGFHCASRGGMLGTWTRIWQNKRLRVPS